MICHCARLARSLTNWETGKLSKKSPLFLWTFVISHYLCISIAKEEMDIIFNEKYLQTMYLTGQTDKKHRYQPQVVRKYIRVIDIMIDVSDVQELLRYNSLNYEKLKGDKAGLSSVRVNDQYRIEFEEQMREGETIATICRIIDLSNHYNNR